MKQIVVVDTFGPIFGLDQMCVVRVDHEVRVGDHLLLDDAHGTSRRDRVVVIDLNAREGEDVETMGIGIRGQGADLVVAGSVVRLEPNSG